MEIAKKIQVLNQPVGSPWTSLAPLQSVTSKVTRSDESMSKEKEEECVLMEHTIGEERHEERHNKTMKSNFPINLGMENRQNIKHSSSQFFHFVRLMQLFPNVHPATLHTVMVLCKNDFFIAVDKLLYAKKCKELYQNRRNLFQGYPKAQRFSPYPCNGNFCQNVSCKPQVIKMDSKRMVARNRYSKIATDKQGPSTSSTDLPPVSLQCNVPIRPLSPVNAVIPTLNISNENKE